jgi:peptidoglycan/LPS O-acetylase OafA/YrhL
LSTYRHELDGLRAIAVCAVILFHAGFDRAQGGFVSLDVYFVISGYLIGGLIAREMAEDRFSLRRFFARRVRRIAPALLVMVILVSPLALWLLLPTERTMFAKTALAIAYLAPNLTIAESTGYFLPTAEVRPLLHTWSVGVEEQFYLLLPFLMALLRRKWRLDVILVLLAMLSFAAALGAFGGDPDELYYRLDARGWELIAGVFCARHERILVGWCEQQRWAWLRQALAIAGLFLLLWTMATYRSWHAYSAWYMAIPVFATLLILLFARNGTWAARILQARPLVLVGLASYSLYLWHQPVFAFARAWTFSDDLAGLRRYLLPLIGVVGFASWHFVERPFRFGSLRSRAVLLSAAMWLAVAVMALAILKLAPGLQNTKDREIAGRIDRELKPNMGLSYKCIGFALAPDCRTKADPEIMVWGDSFAMHLMAGLRASDPGAGLVQMSLPQCSPILDYVPIPSANVLAGMTPAGCLDFQHKSLDWASRQKSLRYVVIGSPFSYAFATPHSLTDRGVVSTDPAEIEAHLRQTVRRIRAIGLVPVIIAPPPKISQDPGRCVARRTMLKADPALCDISEARWRAGQRKAITLLKSVSNEVLVIWPSDLLCRKGRCRTQANGLPIYSDQAHLTVSGSAWTGKQQNWVAQIRSAN